MAVCDRLLENGYSGWGPASDNWHSPPPDCIHQSSRYEHATPMLRDPHWLRSLERIEVGCAHLPMPDDLAPRYLSDYIQRVADSNRRRLRSSSSSQLVIRRTAVHCWRSCVSGGWKPPLEQSAARRHLSSNAYFFRNRLKTYLFSPSFSSIFRFLYTI